MVYVRYEDVLVCTTTTIVLFTDGYDVIAEVIFVVFLVILPMLIVIFVQGLKYSIITHMWILLETTLVELVLVE